MLAKVRFFYGYWILTAAFIILFIMSGCGFYIFGLFVAPLQEELGWSRAAIMTANTVLAFTRGIASFLVGRIIDRHNPRWIILGGSLVSGLGLVLLSITNSLWQFYLFYGIIGVGIAAMGIIPVTAIVLNWFQKRRGSAVGITGIGFGVGGFVMSLLAGGWLIPELGWRMTFIILGLITVLVVIPLVLLVIRTKPQDMGLQADNAPADAATEISRKPAQKPQEGLDLRMALRTPALWYIVFTAGALGFASMGISRNQVPHLTDVGFPAATAAAALGIVGLGNAAGKFIFGLLCDWIKPKYSLMINISLKILALIILMYIGLSSPPPFIWIYAVLMGLGQGGWLPIRSLLVSGNFGLVAYGSIFGLVSMLGMIAGSIGPLFGGYMYDQQQSYRTAFVVFLALYVTITFLTLLIRRPKPL